MNTESVPKKSEGNAINTLLTAGLSHKRIPWNKGKKKPVADEDGLLWCNCDNPKLTSAYGRGQAFCLLCGTPWYH